MKTAKLIGAAGAILLAVTLVSASLLTYFGKVETTMNVQQSIVIGDGDEWFNWDEPVTRELGDVIHCKDYCYKLLVWNRACEDASVDITDVITQGGNADGIDISHYIFGDTQTVHLAQKNVVWGQSPWTIKEDGICADLTFNTCGETFDWEVVSDADLSDYSLIYYANYPEYWTEGPVTVIADLDDGMSGSADVPTMPTADDENALRPISEVGESYAHQYGAKLWIVPTAALTQGGDVDWGQADCFLFETDLAFYLDCDAWTAPDLYCLPNVFPLFDTEIVKAESKYCWISCYHVDFDIAPGTYAFETTFDAEPVAQI